MKELTVDATAENITVVTDFINAQLNSLDCSLENQFTIDVAIDELFGNIVHYAYGTDTGKVTVRFETDDAPPAVMITFIDSGIPFNPLEITEPDTTLPAQEREIGGLGIFLVKQTMDQVAYSYANGQNILMIKMELR